MGVRDPNKREFLMLAGTYDESKSTCIDPTDWYMSEKLDGMRCFWDGGITIGLKASEVPWANTGKEGADHICTGLWSRGGKVIHAPSWFIDDLPKGFFLDGELWNPNMVLQDIVSITRAHNKDEDWYDLKFWIFDSPAPHRFLRAGRIHIRDWEEQLPNMIDWAMDHGLTIDWIERDQNESFRDFVEAWVGHGEHSKSKCWEVLPQTICKGREHLHSYLDDIVLNGGEGVMLRRPGSVWHPRRARGDLQKVKKFYDAEADIVGITFGKETDKDSRLRGMIGALIVIEHKDGKMFELGGLNDIEREITSSKLTKKMEEKAKKYAYDNPGKSIIFDEEVELDTLPKTITLVDDHEEARNWVYMKQFDVNQIVTFKYWDKTKDGIPKFAQYWREKSDE